MAAAGRSELRPPTRSFARPSTTRVIARSRRHLGWPNNAAIALRGDSARRSRRAPLPDVRAPFPTFRFRPPVRSFARPSTTRVIARFVRQPAGRLLAGGKRRCAALTRASPLRPLVGLVSDLRKKLLVSFRVASGTSARRPSDRREASAPRLRRELFVRRAARVRRHEGEPGSRRSGQREPVRRKEKTNQEHESRPLGERRPHYREAAERLSEGSLRRLARRRTPLHAQAAPEDPRNEQRDNERPGAEVENELPGITAVAVEARTHQDRYGGDSDARHRPILGVCFTFINGHSFFANKQSSVNQKTRFKHYSDQWRGGISQA